MEDYYYLVTSRHNGRLVRREVGGDGPEGKLGFHPVSGNRDFELAASVTVGRKTRDADGDASQRLSVFVRICDPSINRPSNRISRTEEFAVVQYDEYIRLFHPHETIPHEVVGLVVRKDYRAILRLAPY
jgi:hypothetical protein